MIKTKVFQLKDIQPNPFRRMEKYPISRTKVEELKESVRTTGFWEDMTVRINDAGKPEIPAGHHRLTALKEMFPGTKEFEWQIRPMSDAVMIQRMSRENGESYRTDTSVLRETITSTVMALAAGSITAEELGIDPKTKHDTIRIAPNFTQKQTSSTAAVDHPKNAYTVVALARFLGMTKSEKVDEPRNSFTAVFGTLELEEEGLLTEAATKGLEVRKLGEVVAAVRKQRDAALAEAVRLAAAAEKQKREAAERAEAAKVAAAKAEKQRVEAAKRLKEAQEKGEKARIEAAKLNLEKQKKAEEAADKQRKVAAEATILAKRKEVEAQKETAEATAHVKGVATQLASEAKTMNRDDIRNRGQEIAEEQAERTGKPAATRKKFHVDVPAAPLVSSRRKVLRQTALELANEGFKSLSRKHHPDHGGTADKQAELNAAIHWLRNLIEVAD